MRAIGGYFELELSSAGRFPHSDGLLVNSGRNALEAILASLPKAAEVFVPRFTCEAVFEPFKRTNTPYIFYDVNDDLELTSLPHLSEKQYLLYTNYFGIKDQYVDCLSLHYQGHLIVDNSQAFFNTPSNNSLAFYSPRKFVGVADGGIVIPPMPIDAPTDQSWARMNHLLKRIDLGPSEGYRDFRENSTALGGEPIKKMSVLTERLLKSIDWEKLRYIRRQNFKILHTELGDLNELSIPRMDTLECPMVYPFRTSHTGLRQTLISESIYVATYWPNVLEDNTQSSSAYKLANSILPLPIDQRYGIAEMKRIARLIEQYQAN